MAERVRVEGLKELEAALADLKYSTRKSVARTVLKDRAKPFAATMKEHAPRQAGEAGGQLQDSIGVSTRLSKRQARQAEREPNTVYVYAGAGALPQAHLEEFGGPNNRPRPFGRPAWDQHKRPMLDGIAADMWKRIKQAADRAARKAARIAAQNGGA